MAHDVQADMAAHLRMSRPGATACSGRPGKFFETTACTRRAVGTGTANRVSWNKPLKRLFKPDRRAVRTAPVQPIAPSESRIDEGKPDTTPQGEPDLPRFQVTASDQVDHRLAGEHASARLRLRNAFTPAQPVVTPAMFAGRRGLLQRLISAVEDERLHAIVYGERGIGKTSLLQVLMTMARQARYQVVYVSCGTSATFDETFRAIVSAVPLLYHESFGPTSGEAESGGVLADLLPADEVTPRFASEFCAKVTGTRVLVVMDEFDRAHDRRYSLDIAEFLKNLSDRSVRVQLVIAGVAGDLDSLMANRGFVQRNVVAIEVPKMSSEEVGELVRNGEERSGLTFDPGAIRTLELVADGMPYIASLLCQQAALTALAHSRQQVCAEDMDIAVSKAANDVGGRLSRRARGRVADLMRGPLGQRLAPVFSLAQTSDRTVSAPQIESVLSSPLVAREVFIELDRLTREKVLVERLEGEMPVSYRFADQNELFYAWLLAMTPEVRKTRPIMTELTP